MKLYIHGQGDTSVGIPDPSAEIDLGDCDLDKTDRKYLRQGLISVFAELWDSGKVGVLFEDECPDCGKLMVLCSKPTTPALRAEIKKLARISSTE